MSGNNLSGIKQTQDILWQNTSTVDVNQTSQVSSGITQWNRVWETWSIWWQGIWLILLGVLIGCVVWWLIAKIYFLQHRSADRKLAVRQSKSTTLGYVSEKIAPLLPDFPYNYKDLVFLGKWVDYICFDGLSAWEMKQVVFIEIKTGKSQLNKNETMIKTTIDKGKVSWETVRL